ncbi:hypothetical protein [Vibrio phage vB_VmeM-Yong XC32]|nr:hypothetical protein [Vibrio phage vB_VmeM-Yong XC31]QAX96611.1 hypothetical protein [Vibrio phage vB_VmeM-Yong XC32]QAX96929.1 hypothetical protein [Vibrio phage vB_VmeM-Yong MS31]QAX97234.1 hypothetical protein [Vibrio phage vB_VmeM-Yong MS32]
MLKLIKGFLNVINPFWKDGFFIDRKVRYAIMVPKRLFTSNIQDCNFDYMFSSIHHAENSTTFLIDGLRRALHVTTRLREKKMGTLQSKAEIIEKFSLSLFLLPLAVICGVFALAEELLGEPAFTTLETYVWAIGFLQLAVVVIANFLYWLKALDRERYTLAFFKGIEVSKARIKTTTFCGRKATFLNYESDCLWALSIEDNLINGEREIRLKENSYINFTELKHVYKGKVAKEIM